MDEKQLGISNINFVQLVMAKQSSIFNFFTKSPSAVAKRKSTLSSAEADLPSISKSSSSQKEEAKQVAQKSKKPAENPNKTLAKVGHGEPFGLRATDTNKRFGENKLT